MTIENRERLVRSALLASAIIALMSLLGVAAHFASVADAYRHRASILNLLAERKSRLDPDRRETRGSRHADVLALFALRDGGENAQALGAGTVVLVRLPEGEFPALVLLDASGKTVVTELLDSGGHPAARALSAAALRRAGGRIEDVLVEKVLGPGVADLALDTAERLAREAWERAAESIQPGASR